MRAYRMSWRKNGLFVLCTAVFVGGVIFFANRDNELAAASNAARERDLADMSIPPVLSPLQKQPDWTVRQWMGIGEKDSDCTRADEMMDKNISQEIRIRRGRRTVVDLGELVSSCRNRPQRLIEMVDPQARKWCAYRTSDPRLDQLCQEWTSNRESYLAEIARTDGPMISRYDAIIGGA